ALDVRRARRAGRADCRAHRRGRHRRGRGPPGPRLRDGGPRLPPPPVAGPAPRHPDGRVAGGVAARVRSPGRGRPPYPPHPSPARRRRPRTGATGRAPRQHRARRPRRPGRPQGRTRRRPGGDGDPRHRRARAPARRPLDVHPPPGPPEPPHLLELARGLPPHLRALPREPRPLRARRATGGSRRQGGALLTTLTSLLREPGVEEALALRGPIGFLALHGGGQDRVTDEIASAAAARAGASLYAVVQPLTLRWHIPSHRYDPAESERLRRFVDHVRLAISVHGYGVDSWRMDWRPPGFETTRLGQFHAREAFLIGGRNRTRAAALASRLREALPCYEVWDDLERIPPKASGMHGRNPVNLP